MLLQTTSPVTTVTLLRNLKLPPLPITKVFVGILEPCQKNTEIATSRSQECSRSSRTRRRIKTSSILALKIPNRLCRIITPRNLFLRSNEQGAKFPLNDTVDKSDYNLKGCYFRRQQTCVRVRLVETSHISGVKEVNHLLAATPPGYSTKAGQYARLYKLVFWYFKE